MALRATTARVLLLCHLAALQLGAGASPFRFNKADLRLLEHSLQLDAQLESRNLVFEDAALELFVSELAAPLAGAPPENVRWQFRVLREPAVNAFALPNGSVYLTTGLLAALENEAQLCALLAHEIAHVRNRDAYLHNRAYRRKMTALNVAAAVPLDALELPVPGVYLRVLAGVSQLLLAAAVRGYAAHVEHEADLFAVNRLEEAGWDPVQVSKALRLMGGRNEPRWIRTLAERRASTGRTGTAESYLAAVEKAVRGNIQADIDTGRFHSSLAASQKLFGWRPQHSEYAFLLGEAYRALGPRAPHGGAALPGRTPEEEEKELLRTPAGAQAAAVNRKRAAELYWGIIARDSRYAKAHRGLGFLLQQQGDLAGAVRELRAYLELEPGALDRRRIERRIAEMEAAK